MLLSTVTSYPAGHELTADEFNALVTAIQDMTLYDEKPLDEAHSLTAVVADDTDLALAVKPNAVYDMGAHIIFTAGAAAATNGFKFGFAGPAGATMKWVPHSKIDTDGTNQAAAIWMSSLAITQTISSGGAGANKLVARASGLLMVSATAGTFKLQWSQATSNAAATTVYAGSFLTLRRIG